MPPVVGLEDDGAARGGAGVEVVAGAIEHERERGPRFTGLRVQPARLARMLRRQRQRRHVGRRIGPRRLELHDARVGEADMTRRVLRRRVQRSSNTSRARDT